MPGSNNIPINPALLKEHGLFAGLSADELMELAKAFRVDQWPSGSRIINENEPESALYFIYQGRVDIFKRVGAREGERQEKIASLGPGETFGEMALLDQMPRSASVVANTDSVVLALDPAELRKIDSRIYAKLLVNLTREVSRHLRATNQSFAVSLFSIHEQARYRLFPKD
jgi:CRP-like cAMP-binding protein